jgi:hypothetical protein
MLFSSTDNVAIKKETMNADELINKVIQYVRSAEGTNSVRQTEHYIKEHIAMFDKQRIIDPNLLNIPLCPGVPPA